MPFIGVIGMVIVLAAAAAFFGVFLGEVPAVIATFLVFWLGHSQAIAKIADGLAGPGRMILRAIYGVPPDLGLLNTRANVSQSMFASAPSVPWTYAGISLAYALLYAIVLFVAALLVFRRRDL